MKNIFISSSNTITPLPLPKILNQFISFLIPTVWCPHIHFNIILPIPLTKILYTFLVDIIQDAKYVFYFNHKLTTLTAIGGQYIMHKEPSHAICNIPSASVQHYLFHLNCVNKEARQPVCYFLFNMNPPFQEFYFLY
jgi:hypothetical protein